MYVLIIVLFVIIFSIIYLPYFCPSSLPTMLKAPVHSAFPPSFCEQLKFQCIFPFPCVCIRVTGLPQYMGIAENIYKQKKIRKLKP